MMQPGVSRGDDAAVSWPFERHRRLVMSLCHYRRICVDTPAARQILFIPTRADYASRASLLHLLLPPILREMPQFLSLLPPMMMVDIDVFRLRELAAEGK